PPAGRAADRAAAARGGAGRPRPTAPRGSRGWRPSARPMGSRAGRPGPGASTSCRNIHVGLARCPLGAAEEVRLRLAARVLAEAEPGRAAEHVGVLLELAM